MDQDSAGGVVPNQTPQELFAACEERERGVDPEENERLKHWLAGELAFSELEPPFEPDAELDAPPSDNDSDDLKVRRAIHYGNRYWALLCWLKALHSMPYRWLLLALWLKQEKICEPRDLLPPVLYEKLISEKLAILRVSKTELAYWQMVEIWIPYFDRLLMDRHRLKKDGSRDPDQELRNAGYDPKAVIAAIKKRTAREAAYEFLANRRKVDAGTIRNAHSKMSRAGKPELR